MKAYIFLQPNPKFGFVFVGEDNNIGNNVRAAPFAEKWRKNQSPPGVAVRSIRPARWDTILAKKQQDFLMNKVRDNITSQIKQGKHNLA